MAPSPESEAGEALWEHIESLAPSADSLAALGRQVNSSLGLEWSDGKWRGIWKRHPILAARTRRQILKSRSLGAKRKAELPANDLRGMVVSDIHAPFHCRKSVDLSCQIARWWDPDVFVDNGDNLEMASLSDYDKDPERFHSIQDEAETWQDEVAAPLHSALSSKAKCYKILGNHEDRLRRQIWRNPGFYGVTALNLGELLELDRLGVELISLHVRFGSLLEISHGVKVSKWAGYSARGELEKRRFGISTITGHVHRAGSCIVQRPVDNHRVVGQEAPCLCSLDPHWCVDPDWVNGVVLFEIWSGKLEIHPIVFHSDHTAKFAGKYFGAGGL